ncbi:MAG TPA: hybrid sensor histidine kinase/response regulator [Gemmataceae bacterium]|nr:hybrid sensor histidine kinase/response regulator [Gemmataceae bacterium]
MSKTAADGPVRVLLVDDDRDDFLLTRDLLDEIPGDGYTLDWVSDYESAVVAFDKCDHDVALVDYLLGARTGLDLLAEVRANGCKMPVILLTGKAVWEVDHAALGGGAADFLEKGRLDATLLERSIRYSLQQRRYEAELEQKVAERTAELERANTALTDADRRKDEFLATLAHELRNPLAPIRNALEIMKLAQNPDGAAAARGIVERQVNQMVRLINDLLDVSRITRGKLELKLETFNVAEAIEASVETSRPLLDEAHLVFEVRPAPRPLRVAGDRLRLAQVFSNLLNNAAKYTEPGGRVTIASAPAGPTVVVTVTDTGVGIPPEVLPNVFELFTQVDRNLDRSQGGLGIGLALVKRLVEMHKGSVAVHSRGVGRGSEFEVRLPLADG